MKEIFKKITIAAIAMIILTGIATVSAVAYENNHCYIIKYNDEAVATAKEKNFAEEICKKLGKNYSYELVLKNIEDVDL